MDNPLSETIKILLRLAGTWFGEGIAEYPTIPTIQYREILTFTADANKSVLHYEQRTWRKDESGLETSSHWESGFWRILQNDEVEQLCAQVNGRLEAARGLLTPTKDGFFLGLNSILVANDTRVVQTRREFDLQGSTLQYALKMQTHEVSALTVHVHAQLAQKS